MNCDNFLDGCLCYICKNIIADCKFSEEELIIFKDDYITVNSVNITAPKTTPLAVEIVPIRLGKRTLNKPKVKRRLIAAKLTPSQLRDKIFEQNAKFVADPKKFGKTVIKMVINNKVDGSSITIVRKE